jgi:signal transduction histidine kinase
MIPYVFFHPQKNYSDAFDSKKILYFFIGSFFAYWIKKIQWVAFLLFIFSFFYTSRLKAQIISTNVDSLQAIYIKEPSNENRIIWLNAMAFKLRNSDVKQAKSYAEQALALSQKIRNKYHQAESLGLLGLLYFRVGEYEKAIIHHFKSLKLAESLNLHQIVAFRYNDIANVYTEQSRYEQALTYHFKSLEIKERIKDWEGIATSHNNICRVYLNMKEYEKAEEHLNKSIAISQSHNYTRALGISYTHWGELFTAQKNYEKALHYHQKAMQLKLSINDIHSYLFNIYSIGRIYFEQKKYTEALKYYHESLDSATHTHSKRRMQVAYEAIATTYAAIGDFKKAFEYERKYALLSDSLFHERHDTQIELLEIQHEAEKKDTELELLRKEAELKQQSSLRREFALYFSIAIVILLVLFLGLLYKHLNEKKRAYLQLQVKNKELSSQKMQLTYQQEELLIRNEQLAELNRETEGLISVVAHDLRSPLNKILGITRIMRYEDFINPAITEYLQMIDKSCASGISLIRDVLLVHNVESENTKLSISTIALKEFLTAHLQQFDAQLQQKQINLVIDLPQEEITLATDENSLMRIIDNLVSNAIKFSYPNTQVTVKVQQETAMTRIAISDEGQGIAPEEQHKMFKKFQRLSARPTGGEESTGLGLSIVKALVDKLKGTIKVTSEQGKGTTFVVTLPNLS